MPAVVEEMHERTHEKEQKGQDPEQMSAVLHRQEESDDGEKSERGSTRPRSPPRGFRILVFHSHHIIPIGMPMGPITMLSAAFF